MTFVAITEDMFRVNIQIHLHLRVVLKKQMPFSRLFLGYGCRVGIPKSMSKTAAHARLCQATVGEPKKCEFWKCFKIRRYPPRKKNRKENNCLF